MNSVAQQIKRQSFTMPINLHICHSINRVQLIAACNATIHDLSNVMKSRYETFNLSFVNDVTNDFKMLAAVATNQ